MGFVLISYISFKSRFLYDDGKCVCYTKTSGLLYRLLFIFILLSTICKGVSIRKWSLHSQKENKGSKKNTGTTLSATSIIWRKSPWESFTGNLHKYSSEPENVTCTVFTEWVSNLFQASFGNKFSYCIYLLSRLTQQ